MALPRLILAPSHLPKFYGANNSEDIRHCAIALPYLVDIPSKFYFSGNIDDDRSLTFGVDYVKLASVATPPARKNTCSTSVKVSKQWRT